MQDRAGLGSQGHLPQCASACLRVRLCVCAHVIGEWTSVVFLFVCFLGFVSFFLLFLIFDLSVETRGAGHLSLWP
jgi:hypothetical protein